MMLDAMCLMMLQCFCNTEYKQSTVILAFTSWQTIELTVCDRNETRNVYGD